MRLADSCTCCYGTTISKLFSEGRSIIDVWLYYIVFWLWYEYWWKYLSLVTTANQIAVSTSLVWLNFSLYVAAICKSTKLVDWLVFSDTKGWVSQEITGISVVPLVERDAPSGRRGSSSWPGLQPWPSSPLKEFTPSGAEVETRSTEHSGSIL